MISKLKYLPILFMALAVWAQDEIRIIPHLAQPRGVFDTWVYIANDTPDLQSYVFQPFDRGGAPLEVARGDVEPYSLIRLKSTALFQNPLATHFLIEGEVTVTVEYASPHFETARAFVQETRVSGTRFRIFPSDWRQVFDGAVVVNLGGEPAHVTIRQLDFDGEELASRFFGPGEQIPPMGKAQLVLGDPLGNGLTYVSDTHVEIVSDQPLAIMALSGDVPLRPGGRLWFLDYVLLTATGQNP